MNNQKNRFKILNIKWIYTHHMSVKLYVSTTAFIFIYVLARGLTSKRDRRYVHFRLVMKQEEEELKQLKILK